MKIAILSPVAWRTPPRHYGPWEQIASNIAEGLVKKGVKEILLIAQELTYYGLDLYKRRALPELLHRLADIPGLHWIRLHYAYPRDFPTSPAREKGVDVALACDDQTAKGFLGNAA